MCRLWREGNVGASFISSNVNDRWLLWLEVLAQLQVLATAYWAQLRQVVRHRVKQKQQRVNDRWEAAQLKQRPGAQLHVPARAQNF